MTSTVLRRRSVLFGGMAGLAAAALGCAPAAAPAPPANPAGSRFAELEARFGGRLGVFAVDTGTGASTGHRADERFLMCSTVKSLLAAAILRRSTDDPGLLDRRIHYTQADLLEYAPVTKTKLATGMTVAELCEAALTVSDNTAANLLTAQLGGPSGTTAFLRSLGDPVTRCDRTETALNDAAPGDERDTSTPAAFAVDLRKLTVDQDKTLTPQQKTRLIDWMVACTTGAAQIRAGVPAGWRVADKTGSGSSGESNDVGVIWPPGRAPIVLAIFTAPTDPHNTTGKPTIASATTIALDALGIPR